jgi:hypothetical protein
VLLKEKLMGWTVIKEDANGKAEKRMTKEFYFSVDKIISKKDFKVLKYIDPYGDTTFNSLMIDDLVSDLTELKALMQDNIEQIDNVIELANECKQEIHTFLKFYGD